MGDGEVEITLGGETKTLKPTLRAAQAVSRSSGGFVEVVRRLAAFDLDTATVVIRHGLNLNDKEAAKLPEAVYATGLKGLVAPLIDYVNALANGGRSLEEAKLGEGAGAPG